MCSSENLEIWNLEIWNQGRKDVQKRVTSSREFEILTQLNGTMPKYGNILWIVVK